MKKLLLILVMLFSVHRMCLAGNYQFHLDLYNAITTWNGLNHGGQAAGDELAIALYSSSYAIRVYQGYMLGGREWGGTFAGGGNVSSSFLGSYYMGYDPAYYGSYVEFFTPLNAVNPAGIAFAGNDEYFPSHKMFIEFPVYNSPGVCWAGMIVNLYNAGEYHVGTGDCYYFEYPVPTPSPSPAPTPSPSPTSSPTPSLSPTLTPIASSSWTPENYPSPVPNVGTLTGSISLDTNGSSTTGSFSATIQMPDTEKLSPYFQSGQAEQNKINEIENAEYTEDIPDKGQPTEVDYTWLEEILNVISNHPIISAVTGSALTASNEICELSCVIFGKEVVFSFCEWAWFFDDLGYFILAFAIFYSIQIAFLPGLGTFWG